MKTLNTQQAFHHLLMRLYWLFLLLTTNFTYGQFTTKGWQHRTDTLQLQASMPKHQKWVIYPLVYQNYRLNIYLNQRSLLQLAKKHYKFLKKTGTSAYFQTSAPCSASQFERIMLQIKQQDNSIIDEDFKTQHSIAFNDFKLVIESLMHNGLFLLEYKKEFLPNCIISCSLPPRLSPTMEEKYIPLHLSGNSGNTCFSLTGKQNCFYSIIQTPSAPSAAPPFSRQ